MSSHTALPFTEPEIEDSQRRLLKEDQRTASLSNVDFLRFTSATPLPTYPYALTTGSSAGPSFTSTPTALGYSDIDPSLLQYTNGYNTAQPPTPSRNASRSSQGESDPRPLSQASAQPQSHIDALGIVYSQYAGLNRSIAPPLERVASSSTSQYQGYRTNFRAPIPIPGSHSANDGYSCFPFGDQAPETVSQYGTLEGTSYSSYNQETRPHHPARNGMPIVGYRSTTQVPMPSSHTQMYPPSAGPQATATAPDFIWDYSEPEEANPTISEQVAVNYTSQLAPPPTHLNAATSNASLSGWTFLNTFCPSPKHSPPRISMKRRRSPSQDDQETAPQGELQDSFLRPAKRLRLGPPPVGVSTSGYASQGSIRGYTNDFQVPDFSTNSQVQHHLSRAGTVEAVAPNPSATQRICLFDNCGATIHSPSAFENHLTSVHHLPRSKGRKDAPRHPCLWLGCFDKERNRREYAGNNIVRHATGHLVARRCGLCTEEVNVWSGCRFDLLKDHYLKKHEVRLMASDLPPLFFI